MDIEELYAIRCMTPHNIDRHLPLLRFLASKCKHITEFGTDEGYSTTAFLAAKPQTLHSYDLHFNHPSLKEICQPGVVAWYRHPGNTLEATIEETDLLFIDTEHTYEQVKGELELHGDKARKFIVLHDITSFPCIVPAIREWLFTHPEWIVREWSLIQSGMAVLERTYPCEAVAVYQAVEP